MGNSADAAYSGSIPEIYDSLLVPVLFAPFAADMVAQALPLAPARILEIAAGTGALTAPLAEALPEARITASDLNGDMIARARALRDWPGVEWAVADAQALPFADASFDLVICQFGAMFFPDRVGAYREMRRVLVSGGAVLLNLWDEIARNEGSHIVEETLCEVLGEPEPRFLSRTPYGHHAHAEITGELAAAGLSDIVIERVERRSTANAAEALLRGLTEGSPLAGEIARHPAEMQARALALAGARLRAAEADHGLGMSALRVTARA